MQCGWPFRPGGRVSWVEEKTTVKCVPVSQYYVCMCTVGWHNSICYPIPEMKTTIISGFSLMIMGWKIHYGQIAAEPLMSSPARLSETRLAGGQKQNRTLPRSDLLPVPSLVDALPFKNEASHRIDVAPSTKNWIGSGKGLMLRSGFCRRGFFCFRIDGVLVRTAFQGYRLLTTCELHTGTGSGSSERARYSLSLSLSLCARARAWERERERESARSYAISAGR